MRNTNPNSETTSFTLDAAGRTTRQDNANGTYVLNSFDAANRTTEIQTKNSSATVLSDIQYGYDGVNLTSRTDSDGTVTTFGFDASNQLTSEVRDNSHSTGYSIGYTYDHNENRTSKTLGGVTDTYTLDSHDKLTSTSSKSFTYDDAGNCTAVTVGGNTTHLTWDDSSRCTGITCPSSATNAFVYNGDDLRVSKTDGAGTSSPITDGTEPASAVLKDARAVYTPGISERAGSASKFYHTDALGSTRGITDSSQAVTDTQLFDAFGMTVSRTGSTATPFGFVGVGQYQTDADSGLMLLGHRMYDASVGRFISSDPAQAGSNWFAYCENNPLIETDSQGLDRDDQKDRPNYPKQTSPKSEVPSDPPPVFIPDKLTIEVGPFIKAEYNKDSLWKMIPESEQPKIKTPDDYFAWLQKNFGKLNGNGPFNPIKTGGQGANGLKKALGNAIKTVKKKIQGK